MDAVEVVPLQQPLVATHVPCDISSVGHDLVKLGSCDQPTLVFVKIAVVLKRKACSSLFLQRAGELRWLLAFGVKVMWRGDGKLLDLRR